ncbi:MAG: Pyrimidine-nucleoside phosphorylase [candidate division BRC1 bacterium ADurb.BinA292]|nr:MAG: Pyrimidine-nucleoside phosphorylase [candidate division BRC1 bacterium ADurb.BinA292]
MRAVDLIHAKRQGERLDAEAIRWLIGEYVRDRIPDYQLAAWLMAVFFRGLDGDELAALTDAMLRSGEIFDWSGIEGVKADKHSTGGVGDKVSLALAPLAAACGLIVPMVSGRGLGHTGGTLDKLEAIPGFKVNLTRAQMRRQLARLGVAMMGQTDRFVPADKRLYALRDVTATVESIPLIAASIMSKKLAEGADVLVLDIKVGSGAFMKTTREARLLGRTMIEIGRKMNRRVAALLTDMNQPLGRAVGHSNEVCEAIELLRGGGPPDLKEVTWALTARMLTLAGLARDAAAARERLDAAVASGAALDRFRRMIEWQQGDPRVVDDARRLPWARREAVVPAPATGWLTRIDTRQIGLALAALGGGRRTKEDRIDYGVGIDVERRLGDRAERGEPLFRVHYRKQRDWETARRMLTAAVTISEPRKRPPRLIMEEL